jgi:hypothetical protein
MTLFLELCAIMTDQSERRRVFISLRALAVYNGISVTAYRISFCRGRVFLANANMRQCLAGGGHP